MLTIAKYRKLAATAATTTTKNNENHFVNCNFVGISIICANSRHDISVCSCLSRVGNSNCMTSQRIESSRSEAAVDHDVDDGYLQQLLLIIYLKCILAFTW